MVTHSFNFSLELVCILMNYEHDNLPNSSVIHWCLLLSLLWQLILWLLVKFLLVVMVILWLWWWFFSSVVLVLTCFRYISHEILLKLWVENRSTNFKATLFANSSCIPNDEECLRKSLSVMSRSNCSRPANAITCCRDITMGL